MRISEGLRGRTTRTVVVVALTLLSALTVAALGITQTHAGMPVGALVTGGTALASGSVLLLRGRRGPLAAPFRRWLGACLVVWGAGQVLHGLIALNSTPRFPTAGDVLSFLATPLAVVGVLAVPRASAGARPALRLLLDSTLLGVTVTLLVWRLGFSSILTASGDAPWFAVPVLLADVMVTCLTLLLALRDLDRHMALTAAGVACYAVGDLVTLHATLPAGGEWPWQGAVLWCLAWPLIAAGLLRYSPSPSWPQQRAGVPVDPDARVVVVTTTLSLALLSVGIVTLLVSPAPGADPVALWLVLVTVVVLWVRELLNAWLRSGLLRRLHDEATADPLTGLANRRVLTARLAAVPPEDDWCLITVDLDGFKSVNDLLGHACGDSLLYAVGTRLQELAPPRSVVSRIGGDEFAVLVPGDLDHGARVARRLATSVRECAGDVEGVHRVPVSASVGVAAVGPGGLWAPMGDLREPAGVSGDPLAALSASNAALRMAKTGGRDRVEVFDRTVARVRRRRLSVEERLRAAVAAGELQVEFQPIVDLTTGRMAGVESLARWVDRELGAVDPGEFIAVAEETGLVVELGEFVLHRSLHLARQAGLPERGVRISCNVSPLQLRVPGFDRIVEGALAAHRIRPEFLVVEVTEAVLVEEAGPAVATLRRLADLGVTVAIDDFGTGYSALGYLRRLPAHVLKIDRSLTVSLLEDASARAVTRAVVDLGHSLGMAVVVEGIETHPVGELVSGMGVSFGQGSLFGVPRPLDLLLSEEAARAAGPGLTSYRPLPPQASPPVAPPAAPPAVPVAPAAAAVAAPAARPQGSDEPRVTVGG